VIRITAGLAIDGGSIPPEEIFRFFRFSSSVTHLQFIGGVLQQIETPDCLRKGAPCDDAGADPARVVRLSFIIKGKQKETRSSAGAVLICAKATARHSALWSGSV
jgi:hypothetical protein